MAILLEASYDKDLILERYMNTVYLAQRGDTAFHGFASGSLFYFDKNVEDFKTRYRSGNIGDVEIKTYLSNVLNDFLEPIREKRLYFESNMNIVEEALDKGIKNARESANETMELVRDKMKVSTYKKIW